MKQATWEPNDIFWSLVTDAPERTFKHWEEDPITLQLLWAFIFLPSTLPVKNRVVQLLLSKFKWSPVGKDAWQWSGDKKRSRYWNITLQRSEQRVTPTYFFSEVIVWKPVHFPHSLLDLMFSVFCTSTKRCSRKITFKVK